MFGVLNVLLVGGFLLRGALGKEFGVSLNEQIEAVSGSCVTIPCSFTVRDDHKNNLNSDCKALWKDEKDRHRLFTGQTEDLTQKNCTTTLYNINHQQHHGTFYFRLDCDNALKWTFINPKVNIKVTGAPPALTLTPPTLSVTEGESVSVQCSAPVPCLSLPPTLTWSPVLGDIQETFKKQNNAFVKVSTLNFTASHSHHEKNITCSAVYSRGDVTSELSLRAQRKTVVKYQPRNFSVTVNPPGAVPEHSNVTLKCSSEAHPPAQLYHWYNSDGVKDTLIGNSSVLNIKASKDTTAVFCEAQNDVGTERSTVTQLDILFVPKILSSSNCTGDWSQMSCLCEAEGNPSPLIQWYFPGVSTTNISITSEALSDTSVRSVITVKDAQWRDPVTLLCHSSNSLGFDAQTFTFSTLDKGPDQQSIPGVLTLVMMVSTAVLVLLVLVLLFVIRSLVVRLRKVPCSPETNEQQKENADAAGSAACSSQDDVLYSNVTWKTKSDLSCSSYLEEQRSTVGDGRKSIVLKEAECEYAQVKFKPRAATGQ